MLSYIILIIFQIIAALFFAPFIMRYIPLKEDFTLFVYGVLFAVLIWLVGQIGGEVLKGMSRPSGATLTASLICALIGAAIIFFFPQIAGHIPVVVQSVYFPLFGALIGYYVKK
ncbi:MAG: hypothetical protein AAF228_07815 [Pseudomonadota bacterium]